MGFNAKDRNSDTKFVPAPALENGAYPARIVGITLLGEQPQRPYQGKEKPPREEISLTYELLDEFLEDDEGNEDKEKPRWISETFPFYGLSAENARSTERYYALDPDEAHEGDWLELLGMPCMVTLNRYKDKRDPEIVRNGVVTVSAMREKEAKKAPPLVNPTRVFDFDNPDMDVYNDFPQWLQEKLQKAVNFKGGKLEALLNGGEKQEQENDEPSDDSDDSDDW